MVNNTHSRVTGEIKACSHDDINFMKKEKFINKKTPGKFLPLFS